MGSALPVVSTLHPLELILVRLPDLSGLRDRQVAVPEGVLQSVSQDDVTHILGTRLSRTNAVSGSLRSRRWKEPSVVFVLLDQLRDLGPDAAIDFAQPYPNPQREGIGVTLSGGHAGSSGCLGSVAPAGKTQRKVLSFQNRIPHRWRCFQSIGSLGSGARSIR